MKTQVKEEQFLTDAKGKRTDVILDLKTYHHLLEAEEELTDIRAYDALHDRVHSEIAVGEFATLTSYRNTRGRKKKIRDSFLEERQRGHRTFKLNEISGHSF